MTDKPKLPPGWCWDWGGIETEAISRVQSAVEDVFEEEFGKQSKGLTAAMERMVFEILQGILKNIKLEIDPAGVRIWSLNDEWSLDVYEIVGEYPTISFEELFINQEFDSIENAEEVLGAIEKNFSAAMKTTREKIESKKTNDA